MRLVNRRFILVLLLVCCLPTLAGDGKMFVTRGMPPPTIPAQRALIVHDAGVQTLVLQSGYNISPGEMVDSASLGWVVPVPGVPEVAALAGYWGQRLFRYLSKRASPKIVDVGSQVRRYVLLASILGLVVSSVLNIAVLNCKHGRMDVWRRKLFRCSAIVALCMIVIDLVSPSLLSVPRLSTGGVRIVDHYQVGIYNVRVVAGDDATDIVVWLDQQGFAYDADDHAVFNSYINRGWCFVVVQINAAVMSGGTETVMLQPLILRFDHPEPVYPLALTGTGGHDTHVELHVIARQQMADDGRLPRVFAGHVVGGDLDYYLNDAETDPPAFLAGCLPEHPYLTTFSGRLSPDDMARDLVLTPAPERGDFRERVVRW